jgi:hypothetical protein
MEVPASLRTWFVAHFVVDLIAGLPLLLAPEAALRLVGWTAVDPVATRLVGAALLGIGGQSLRVRSRGVEAYRALLGLKVIWSLAAIFALGAGIAAGAPQATWAFLSIFIVFSGVWIHYAVRFRQLSRANDAPDTTDAPDAPDAPDDEAAS